MQCKKTNVNCMLLQQFKDPETVAQKCKDADLRKWITEMSIWCRCSSSKILLLAWTLLTPGAISNSAITASLFFRLATSSSVSVPSMVTANLPAPGGRLWPPFRLAVATSRRGWTATACGSGSSASTLAGAITCTPTSCSSHTEMVRQHLASKITFC